MPSLLARRLACTPPVVLALCALAAPASSAGAQLVTRPDLTPPRIRVTTPAAGTAPGLIAIGPKRAPWFLPPRVLPAQSGPMLIDDQGRARFFQSVSPLRGAVTDVRVQEYQGKPVLTWWQGRAMLGEGHGAGLIFDTSYRPIAKVVGGKGELLDLHEFLLTPQGTALVMIYRHVLRDLRSVGGGRSAEVIDGIIQEVDVATRKLLVEWRSTSDIAFSESYERQPPRGGPWDYVHFNSVSLDADGNILVSARHTSAVYKIDRSTGKLIWRLGGKRSDFKLPAAARFSWQHDVRGQAPNVIRMLDNDDIRARPRPPSRALTLALDPAAKTARVVRSIANPEGLSVGTQGNADLLANGNTMVGWGAQGRLGEFGPDGKQLFAAKLPRGMDTYRAFRAAWSARPLVAPRVAAEARRGGRLAIHMSWNGSTEVQRWTILAGPSAGALTPVRGTKWYGLETGVVIRSDARYVAAQAKTADGTLLATTTTVRVSR